MTHRTTLLLTLIAIFTWGTLSTFAQSISGNLTGTVYDPSGGTIPGAKVTARNEATGVETSTVSTSDGNYTIPNLPAGTYTILVTASGFAQAQQKGVAVALNQTVTSNVHLEVGQSTQTVEVTAAGATIDTTTAQLQQTFGPQQLSELPTASSGSGVINLSLLNAGVTSSGGVGVGTGPSVGGQRPRDNNFTIEGIDNNNDSVTGPVVGVPNDAVQEFTVLQNQFGADFGHSSGGQFNQVVRSGGNDFHGALYEYLENRNMNAADNLSSIDQIPLHPRFDNNRFGGDVGGPIRKNKLFFFVDYEYNPIGGSASGGLIYAPTAAGYSTLASMPGINQTNLGILQKYLGTAPSAASTASLGGAYPLVGPGNASLGNQLAGAQSVQIGQIGVIAPSFTNNENAVVSIDDNVSEFDAVRGRFILNRSGTIDTSASLPAFFGTIPTNAYLATLSEFHTFSPTTTNEFRLGFNRLYQNIPVGNFAYSGLDVFPNITLYELGGVNIGPDPNGPQFTIQNTYQLTDNVSITHGAHTIKFGFDGYRLISPQSFTQRARGDYEYSYLSDYLFDYNPDYLAQRSLGNVTYYGNRWWVAGFANDAWKVRPNLTVNLGLRYEYVTIPLTEQQQTLNSISNAPGVITFQKPQPQTDAWMPRIGIAYSPGTSGKTSIRAGFGRNFDVMIDNFGLLTLPPQLTTTVDVTGLDQGNFLAHGGITPNTNGGTLSQADARAGTGGYVPNEQRPESLQWNFGVQHVFHGDYTVESRYVGTRGLHLPVQIQLNRQPVVNASNSLPLFYSQPSQATLNGLTNTLDSLNSAYNASANVVPGYLNAGFTGIITSYQPWGSSTYHGWANQVTRRFANGLQFTLSYTLSHDIDNSTAEVFSTYLTPRRPQDSTNLNMDRSSSALDHRQRLSAAMVYQLNPFKNGNWFLKNIVGNWEIAPVYIYQTGTLYDVQSGVDSNLNGDSAGDRAFVNPSGSPSIGSGTTALKNSAGATVGFLVNNPNARYIAAPKGTLPNGGRNTEHLNPIDDLDMTFAKSFNFTERVKVQFAGRFFNILNHPQYIGGFLNDVAPIGFTGGDVHNFLIPGSGVFGDPTQVFSSNPRNIQVSAKITF
ncbi:MAG TPA: carboxypeptidase regulatory-like domain-containing protein [Candidatus Sulfopaludibacter sp.]|nr:carboxypeptidase regulatory-like domain-containing protein [Candidatus Sulfopaludibacter sp.]